MAEPRLKHRSDSRVHTDATAVIFLRFLYCRDGRGGEGAGTAAWPEKDEQIWNRNPESGFLALPRTSLSLDLTDP